MRGQQETHFFNSMDKGFRKVTMFEARLHYLNDLSPEIVSALGVHPGITDHRKLVRRRSDENQDGVPQRRTPHFQPREAMTSLLERMVDFSPADIDSYFTARPAFGCGNRRHNSVVVDSLEEMMRFHCGISMEITNRHSHRRRRCLHLHRRIHRLRRPRLHHPRRRLLHQSTRPLRIRVTPNW